MTTLLEKVNIKYEQIVGNNMEFYIGDALATAFGYNLYSPMHIKYIEESK